MQILRSSDRHSRDALKLTNKIPVELAVHFLESLICDLARHRRLVGATFDEGTKNIRYRENTNQIGYLAPAEPMRISRSVEIFMVVKHHIDHFGWKPGHGCERFQS